MGVCVRGSGPPVADKMDQISICVIHLINVSCAWLLWLYLLFHTLISKNVNEYHSLRTLGAATKVEPRLKTSEARQGWGYFQGFLRVSLLLACRTGQDYWSLNMLSPWGVFSWLLKGHSLWTDWRETCTLSAGSRLSQWTCSFDDLIKTKSEIWWTLLRCISFN